MNLDTYLNRKLLLRLVGLILIISIFVMFNSIRSSIPDQTISPGNDEIIQFTDYSLSPSGDKVLLMDFSTYQVFDLASSEVVWTKEFNNSEQLITGNSNFPIWDPSGERFVITTYNSAGNFNLILVDTGDGEIEASNQIGINIDSSTVADWIASNRRIAISSNNQIHFFDIEADLALDEVVDTGNGAISGITIDPYTDYLIVLKPYQILSIDYRFLFTEQTRFVTTNEIPTNIVEPLDVEVNSDGDIILISKLGDVLKYDLETGNITQYIFLRGLQSYDIDQYQEMMIYSTEDGSAHILDLIDLFPVREVEDISSLDISATSWEGDWLLFSSTNSASENNPQDTLEERSDEIYAIKTTTIKLMEFDGFTYSHISDHPELYIMVIGLIAGIALIFPYELYNYFRNNMDKRRKVKFARSYNIIFELLREYKPGISLSVNRISELTNISPKLTEDVITTIIENNPAIGTFSKDAMVFTKKNDTRMDDLTSAKVKEERACCKLTGRLGEKYCNICGRVVPDEFIMNK